MPLLLILGPIFGLAALAAIVASSHKGAATPHAPAAHPQETQQFEIDHGMPEVLVHQVLTALVHGQDPAQLEALARELGAKYPIAASELHTKAASLGGVPATTPHPHAPAPGHTAAPVPEHHAGAAAAASPSPDLGEAAVILQAAMRAYAHETDPVSLEGFAESIRAKYPTATVLLLGRAQELRAAAQAQAIQTSSVGVTAGAPIDGSSAPVPPAPPIAPIVPIVPIVPIAPPPAPPPATYVVQAGDTPTLIAEKLAHDGKHWPELVAANPGKPTSADGSFASLRPGETLHLPASWGAATTTHATHAHASALPKEAHP